MATFAELSCFNKLLLEKMEKLVKENKQLKKEQQRQKEIIEVYESLEIALNEYSSCWNEDVGVCVGCDKYKGFDEMKEIDDEYYCMECVNHCGTNK